MSENITEAQAKYIADLEAQVFITTAVRDQYRRIMGEPETRDHASQYINWLLDTRDDKLALAPTYFTAVRALRREDADDAVLADLDAALAQAGMTRTSETVRLTAARNALVTLSEGDAALPIARQAVARLATPIA